MLVGTKRLDENQAAIEHSPPSAGFFMSVAFVSAGRATPVFSGTSITVAVTRGAANYLVCFPMGRDNALLSNGATYDGNAMTQIIAPAIDGGVHIAAYGFALSTDANLVGSFDGSINNVAQMSYALFAGVDTGNPTIDSDTAGEATTDLDFPALTGGSTDDMAVGAGFLRAASTMTGETGTTVRDTGNEATFGSTVAIGTAAGSASVVLGFNLGAGAEAFGGSILLRASAAAVVRNSLLLLGVG